MKTKLIEIKNKFKKHAPAIVSSVITVAAVGYAVVLRKELAEERERFPKGEATYLAMSKGCVEELMEKGQLIWTIDEHKIDLAYDPDCAVKIEE